MSTVREYALGEAHPLRPAKRTLISERGSSAQMQYELVPA
jgi:hypothetical protein